MVQEMEKGHTEGTVVRLDRETTKRTKFWTPVFLIPKKESSKVRLISDMRTLNNCFQCPKHQPDTWKTVLQLLQSQQFLWGLTLDLRSWFHHLALHRRSQRWVRYQVHHQAYQQIALPFGLKCSPFWSHRLSHPILKYLRSQGITLVWYVDDILLLGTSKEQVESQAAQVVQLLTKLGIQVNVGKSLHQATQTPTYLGTSINLPTRQVLPLQHKLAIAIKQVKRLSKAKTFVPRYAAQAAGTLLDLAKGMTNLRGLYKVLMSLAGRAAQATKVLRHCSTTKAWMLSTPKPPSLPLLFHSIL